MVKPLRAAPKPEKPARAPRPPNPIAQRLRREILTGRYRTGEMLPPERALAERLGTNRNTLREALRMLESERLIAPRQGEGTRVLDWRTLGEIHLLPWFLVEPGPARERLSAVFAMLELRETLLDQALARAAAAASDEDLDRLAAALAQLSARRRGAGKIEADVEVYRELVLASHELVLVWVFNTFARIFLELGQRFGELWVIDDVYLNGLQRVYEALRARKGDRARAELRRVFADRGVLIDAALGALGAPAAAKTAAAKTTQATVAKKKGARR